MKKVIELIRVSTAEQAAEDRASIPAQRAVNRKTAAAYGLTITKSIEMSDVSGTAVLRTPEMQELLKLIESPEIKGVVVREFSRVMRPDNFGDYVLFQVFQDTGTLLYLPDGPLDFNSKTGKLVAGLRAIISGNELSEIRERIWTGKEELRRAGKHAQGSVALPFGVGYSKEKGFFFTPESEMVRDAWRRLLSGETSYTQLAKPLGFTPQGMRTLFTNPIYTGWRVYNKKRDMAPSAKRYSAAVETILTLGCGCAECHQKLDALLLAVQSLIQKENQVDADLQKIIDQAKTNTDAEAAANAALVALFTKLTAALAGSGPISAADRAALQATVSSMQSSSAALAAAIVANTPAA